MAQQGDRGYGSPVSCRLLGTRHARARRPTPLTFAHKDERDSTAFHQVDNTNYHRGTDFYTRHARGGLFIDFTHAFFDSSRCRYRSTTDRSIIRIINRLAFFPNQRFDRPQPIYGIPEARRKEGKYEEAIAGFMKIIEDHPQEIRAWLQMIEVAAIDLQDTKRAEGIYTEGMKRLREEEDRAHLTTMYKEIQSR